MTMLRSLPQFLVDHEDGHACPQALFPFLFSAMLSVFPLCSKLVLLG